MQSPVKTKQEEILEAGKLPTLHKYLPLIFIISFWLLAASIIGVSGDFPLNDDWVYSEAVRHFVQTGEIRISGCSAACLFQIVTAASVCKIFGFSYTILRTYNVFCALISSVLFYGCLRLLQLQRPSALLSALCFSSNPLFVCVAFSFMSDTPAIALTFAYLYFMLKGLKSNQTLYFLPAALSLAAACSIRQSLGIMILPNFIVFVLLVLQRRISWTFIFGLVILPLASALISDRVLLAASDFPESHIWYKSVATEHVKQLLHYPGRNIPVCLQNAGQIMLYLGLFSIPVILSFFPVFKKYFRNKGNINPALPMSACAFMVFTLARMILLDKRWMPFNQNTLRLPELGAHNILGLNYPLLASKWRENLTWLSGAAGFMLSTLLLDSLYRAFILFRKALRPERSALKRKALLTCSGRTLCAIAVSLVFMVELAFNILQAGFIDIDRYYLLPLSGALLVLALSWRWHRVRLCWTLAVPACLMMAIYSLAGTQDLLAWNRARWQAISKLEAQGVSYKEIDGGAEYNFVRNPSSAYDLKFHRNYHEFAHRGRPPRDNWRWWNIAGEQYIISFSPVPEYDIVSREPYWSYLGGRREILVLRRHG